MTNRANQNWPEVQTITAETDSVSAVWFACARGKFILRVQEEFSPNWADVLDSQGNVIGDAHQMYSDGGWAVHTAPFAGYVSPSQVVFV